MDNQEGWYEFSHNVNVKEFSESFIEPIGKVKAEEYPFRTTCYKIDRVWHVLEANLKIDPPDCDLTEGDSPVRGDDNHLLEGATRSMQQTSRGRRRATGGGQ